MNYTPYYMMMQQLQQIPQIQQFPQMAPMRIPMIPQPPQLQTIPQPTMPFQMQQQNPVQQKVDRDIPVSVKGTKVKLNLKMIKDLPLEDDSILDYDEIKKQSGDHKYINLKRKRRLLDQQEAPLMQTRRRSEQSQQIREMLKVDDKDMTIILEAYPDTKTLLQELRKGNLKREIEKLLPK
ncbi:unnamed protein product (macronuclear) [Paramecium tetraurelia]|uniref:Nascent polypeptide-associated complex subunit alpha-like UBA domain-containing protein n=1 Tax=Paramecium tetraurelia TaxID=5888 RepID=A0CP73_PARTE|nr:uncharacterized protein GSPATT00008981001 [Paramecium tetraurelia]CAK72590.1 unnamed protein product [Paramecium tetraurelia]|eukprot:XP_001439987.1 hypothetical protein (macronuclear) [Paramecium tetraurelia strain d4-2]